MTSELGGVVGRRRLLSGTQGVLHVVGFVAVSPVEVLSVPDQQGSAAIGQEQALVRVERHGIGAIDALEAALALFAEDPGAAIGPVDVQPEAEIGTQVGKGAEGVDGAGVADP